VQLFSQFICCNYNKYEKNRKNGGFKKTVSLKVNLLARGP